MCRQWYRRGRFSAEHFEEWLFRRLFAAGKNLKLSSFHDLVNMFWGRFSLLLRFSSVEESQESQKSPDEYDFATFTIADVTRTPVNQDWINPHIRLLAIMKPNFKPLNRGSKVFIVGSSSLTSQESFLQVASWDTEVFHYYGVCPTQHIEFNLELRSSVILEWSTQWWRLYTGLDLLRQFRQRLRYWRVPWSVQRPCQRHMHNERAPWVIGLASICKTICVTWRTQKKLPKSKPQNIPRWMAHLLLTTTVNFATCKLRWHKLWCTPRLFFNRELLALAQFSDILVSVTESSPLKTRGCPADSLAISQPNHSTSDSIFNRTLRPVLHWIFHCFRNGRLR